jgi:hypothetical protein
MSFLKTGSYQSQEARPHRVQNGLSDILAIDN